MANTEWVFKDGQAKAVMVVCTDCTMSVPVFENNGSEHTWFKHNHECSPTPVDVFSRMEIFTGIKAWLDSMR